VFILLSVQCSLVHRPWIFLDALQFCVLIQCTLVLRPAGSITAFQHHVTRSLRRFHVGSPGSSPCWLDHCVSTPCDSITVAVLITMWLDHCVSTPCDSITAVVPRWNSRFFALLARYLTRWKYRICLWQKERVSISPAPQMV
jgi:hypothetical protein